MCVAGAVARVAVGTPVNSTVEVAGPEEFRLDELIRGMLAKRDDPREVVADPKAFYFGINPSGSMLLPGPDARLAETRFGDWYERQLAAAADGDVRDGEDGTGAVEERPPVLAPELVCPECGCRMRGHEKPVAVAAHA